MKLKITLLFMLVTVAVNAQQQFRSPLDYLNYITAATDNLSQSTWNYTSAVAHSKSARMIENKREDLIKSIQLSHQKISDLKNGYKGDIEFRDQILAFLKLQENYINDDYDKIIDMQEVAEQSYDYMEAYIMARDLVNQKIKDEIDKLNNHQRNFGKKYKITITEDKSELGKKMAISNQVFKNHTEIYLIFFKANVTEINFMQAIEVEDLNAIQQNLNALEQYSREGLEKLKTFQPYKDDQSMVAATEMALEFYLKEAAELGPEIISFLMKRQQLDETQKVLESKSQKKLKNAEIENYNKLVEEVNNAVASYNRKNNQYNDERSMVVGNWNYVGENFVSKHVPKN